MSLSPGTRLGSYEVTALIGQGGMGEVYRARDTKLDHDVAIQCKDGVSHACEGRGKGLSGNTRYRGGVR